jgi:hypothetical protein
VTTVKFRATILNFRIWGQAAYCDYATTLMFRECMFSLAEAAKFDYLTTGKFRATISKIEVPGLVGLGDYTTTLRFGTPILKFKVLVIGFLTVTT